MKYDVEADWLLLKTCNFRCSYCFYLPEFLNSKLKVYGSPLQWQEGFNATNKTWLIHITGGEPSLYPDFVELCEKLTQQHYLSINTNLTHRCISDFVQRINPERIHFINAALHFEERQKRKLWKIFIERVHELQKANFKVLLSLVMTPQMVHKFPKISESLTAQGLFPIPKIIRGTYQGKSYPSSYSTEEKHLIYQFGLNATIKYDSLLKSMTERPTINMLSDHIFLNGIKDYRGLMCNAGSSFVSIKPNGMVFRCESSEIYGNILLKNVRLLDKPKVCSTWYCPYFCEKYSLKDKKYDIIYQSNISKVKNIIEKLYYYIKTDGYDFIGDYIAMKIKNR